MSITDGDFIKVIMKYRIEIYFLVANSLLLNLKYQCKILKQKSVKELYEDTLCPYQMPKLDSVCTQCSMQTVLETYPHTSLHPPPGSTPVKSHSVVRCLDQS